MALKDLLSNNTRSSTSITDIPSSTGRIVRTTKIVSFDFKDEPGSYSKFEEFLASIDHSDIVRCQFSSDLTKVKVVYAAEVKRIPRKEYDVLLPVEQLTTNLFSNEGETT